MNYIDVLNDPEIIAIYNQIDMAKTAEVKHFGIQHTLNTIEYAKQLAICFNLTPEDERLLLISASLHNIGHLNGKNLHAQTGAEMARTYLKKSDLSAKEINVICNAIASHVGKRGDDFYNEVSACLILADKMDFGAWRYKEDVLPTDKEEIEFRKITHLQVNNIDQTVELLVGGQDINWQVVIQSNEYFKIYSCFQTVCKKAGLNFRFKRKR